MARIVTTEARGGYVVTVRGRLSAADLRRFERACGPAVERRSPLQIVLARGSAMDASARAYVDRLRARGAVVTAD